MTIPDKTYLTFAEAAERWNVTVDHIDQWAWEQHLLRPVIRLEGLKGFTGNTQDGWVEGDIDIRLKYFDSAVPVDKSTLKHIHVAHPAPRDETQNDLRNFYLTMQRSALFVVLGKSVEEVTKYQDDYHRSEFMEDDFGNNLYWDVWMDTMAPQQVGTVFLQTQFFLWIEEVKSFEDNHPDLIAMDAKSPKQKPRKSVWSEKWKAEIESDFLLSPSTYALENALEYIRNSIDRPDSIFVDIEETAISSIDDIKITLNGKLASIKGKTVRNFISKLHGMQKAK